MPKKLKIATDYWAKPIPTRSCDWSAVLDDTYDGSENDPIGYGETEEEAIKDLLFIIDREDAEIEVIGSNK